MASCVNPECVNGRTPGVIAAGKGTANAPVIGASLRWGWTNCRSCSPSDNDKKKGVSYVHVNRTPAEIAQRAQLANSKASYEAKPSVTAPLQKIASAAPGTATLNGVSQDKYDKLMDRFDRLTEQLTELLEENRSLRAALDAAPKRVKRIPKSH